MVGSEDYGGKAVKRLGANILGSEADRRLGVKITRG